MLRMDQYAAMYHRALLRQIKTKTLMAAHVQMLWHLLGQENDVIDTLITIVAEKVAKKETIDRGAIKEMRKRAKLRQMFEQRLVGANRAESLRSLER